MIIDRPEQIELYRMLVLEKMLRLEILGLKMGRGKTAYSAIKKEYSLKGSRQKVCDIFKQMIEATKQKGEINE